MDRDPRNRRSSIYLLLLSFTITAAVVTIYHWISLIYRRRRPLGMPPEFNGAAASGTDMAVSIEASTAELIAPARSFRKGKVVGDEECGGGGGACPVCLSELEDGEAVRLLPECGHCFHVDCIDLWFRCHSTCPVCRSDVRSL